MKSLEKMKRSTIDFLLSGSAASLTVVSLGMSLAYVELGLAFAALIVLGTVFSRILLKAVQSTWLDRVGIGLYIVGAMASPFLSQRLNIYLPGEGFPRELMYSAAPLTWMVAIGSFFAWRDQTLLFQCVPCIALFGLVGAFNTFDGATVTFFVFLICASVLYARSHQRGMLDRAKLSGYPKIEAIHGGPWRYMAGPEWGILSAAVVIVLSAIGAPIIQLSVKQVSGVVSIRAPQVQPPAPTNMPSAVAASPTRRVGQGPIGRLSDRELFRIKLPSERYLRVSPYSRYIDGVWSNAIEGGERAVRNGQPHPFPYVSNDDLVKNFELAPMQFRFSGGMMSFLPIPTPFAGMNSRSGFRINSDGTVSVLRSYRSDRVLEGLYYRLKPSVSSDVGPPDSSLVQQFKRIEGASFEVVEWARDIAANYSTNREKADAIKKAIETRARYNLLAEAAPEGQDPVHWFLFGPKREGYCDLFASSMVLMARAADIPARYVVGYYPVNKERDESGFFVLRESDAHAWAELYFDGIGWIPFDATEGAVEVPGGERGAARDATALFEREGFWLGVGIVGVLLVVGAVAAVARVRRMGMPPELLAASKLVAAYEGFVDSLELATGQMHFANESPTEFVRRLGSDLDHIFDPAHFLARSFSAAFYGPKMPTLESIQELETRCRAFSDSSSKFAKQRRKRIMNH